MSNMESLSSIEECLEMSKEMLRTLESARDSHVKSIALNFLSEPEKMELEKDITKLRISCIANGLDQKRMYKITIVNVKDYTTIREFYV